MWLQNFKPPRKSLRRFLFCLDISRSADHQDHDLYLLSHRFKSSCSQAYFECEQVDFIFNHK